MRTNPDGTPIGCKNGLHESNGTDFCVYCGTAVTQAGRLKEKEKQQLKKQQKG